MPPRAVRNLRDLTRHRAQLASDMTRVVNRIHKLLQDANIKLDAVASDILGVSGRDMLDALQRGEKNVQRMAEMARGRLRGKIPQLELALEGQVTEHHRYLLQHLLKRCDGLEEEIGDVSLEIERRLSELLPSADVRRLDAIPGVNAVTIQNLIAEIGPDMNVFPDEYHLSSWAGVCPGNEESAGKRLRSATRHGNRWLRRALTEAAWAASRTKHSYFAAQYRRLATRRGKKRALMAVGHSILITAYHILKDQREYKDLGRDYFDRLDPDRLQRYLVRRLESLGLQVTVRRRETTPA